MKFQILQGLGTNVPIISFTGTTWVMLEGRGYSFIDGVRTSNENDIIRYINGISEGKNIKSFGEHLPDDQFASETVIMSLRYVKAFQIMIFTGDLVIN